MSRRLAATALLIAAALAGASPAAAATPATNQLSATVDRARIATQLGRSFEFRSTITNSAATPASGLVAQLSVLSLRSDPYVDPEDWSSRRVVFLDPIPAGGSKTLRWRMTAVNAGTFGVYVTVLSTEPADAPARNTPTIDLRVAERRTLDAAGIVPLAFAVPALLAGLAIVLRVRRRAR
jgi:hypothetical protein